MSGRKEYRSIGEDRSGAASGDAGTWNEGRIFRHEAGSCLVYWIKKCANISIDISGRFPYYPVHE
jgi:hypothetical protein